MKIESHEEHSIALAAIDTMMTILGTYGEDPAIGALLGLVATSVEAYEEIHFPLPEPTPEEAAAFRAEEGRLLDTRFARFAANGLAAQVAIDQVVAARRPAAGAPIVHHLHHGVTACRKPGVPAEWPPGEVWSTNWSEVNCQACLDQKAAHPGDTRRG